MTGRATYICYDCSKPTKATVAVRRGPIATLVCRAGTGCHKATTTDALRAAR